MDAGQICNTNEKSATQELLPIFNLMWGLWRRLKFEVCGRCFPEKMTRSTPKEGSGRWRTCLLLLESSIQRGRWGVGPGTAKWSRHQTNWILCVVGYCRCNEHEWTRWKAVLQCSKKHKMLFHVLCAGSILAEAVGLSRRWFWVEPDVCLFEHEHSQIVILQRSKDQSDWSLVCGIYMYIIYTHSFFWRKHWLELIHLQSQSC